MNLVLLSAKRAMGCPEGDLRVGKPHGAESGFDPHSAFKDVDDSNFFQYICGEILGPEEPSEWVCAAPPSLFCVSPRTLLHRAGSRCSCWDFVAVLKGPPFARGWSYA
jgi:hypothetical protein